MPFRPRGRSQTTFTRRRIVNIVCERPPTLPEKLNINFRQGQAQADYIWASTQLATKKTTAIKQRNRLADFQRWPVKWPAIKKL